VKVDCGVLKSKVDDGFKMVSEKLDAVGALGDRVTAMELRERVRTELEAERAKRRWFRLKVVGGVGSAVVALLVAILKLVFANGG
jgi:hypothetical protein